MQDLKVTATTKHKDEIKPPGSQKAPEDFFDEDQVTRDRYNKLKETFAYLWTGPEGFRVDQNYREDKEYPGRTKNKALPDAPYGALIGVINPTNSFDRKDFFLIGANKIKMPAPVDGELWLNVNDVIDKNDPRESKIYYFDNIGFFW